VTYGKNHFLTVVGHEGGWEPSFRVTFAAAAIYDHEKGNVVNSGLFDLNYSCPPEEFEKLVEEGHACKFPEAKILNESESEVVRVNPCMLLRVRTGTMVSGSIISAILQSRATPICSWKNEKENEIYYLFHTMERLERATRVAANLLMDLVDSGDLTPSEIEEAIHDATVMVGLKEARVNAAWGKHVSPTL